MVQNLYCMCRNLDRWDDYNAYCPTEGCEWVACSEGPRQTAFPRVVGTCVGIAVMNLSLLAFELSRNFKLNDVTRDGWSSSLKRS